MTLKDLFSLHNKAASNADGTSGNDGNEGEINGSSQTSNSLGADLGAGLVNKVASNTGNGIGDGLGRGFREDLDKRLGGVVDEEGTRETSAENNTEHLAAGHEADAVGNLLGLDLHLGDCEASLAEAADTSTKDDGVSVNLGVACMFVNGVCEDKYG